MVCDYRGLPRVWAWDRGGRYKALIETFIGLISLYFFVFFCVRLMSCWSLYGMIRRGRWWLVGCCVWLVIFFCFLRILRFHDAIDGGFNFFIDLLLRLVFLLLFVFLLFVLYANISSIVIIVISSYHYYY